jgi:hypothetical protein
VSYHRCDLAEYEWRIGLEPSKRSLAGNLWETASVSCGPQYAVNGKCNASAAFEPVMAFIMKLPTPSARLPGAAYRVRKAALNEPAQRPIDRIGFRKGAEFRHRGAVTPWAARTTSRFAAHDVGTRSEAYHAFDRRHQSG